MLTLLRDLLLENLGIKLVALLLAVALYLHVYTERPATMVLSFPLELADLADSLSVVGPAPDPVRAELRGTGKQLIRLRLTEPRIKVSLAGIGAGHYERTVVAEDLPLLHDEGVEVQRLIGPRMIGVDIDRLVEKRVPVEARVQGTPHAGWSWNGTALIDPPTVALRGPRRSVHGIDRLNLAAVHVDGKSDTVRARVGADSLPAWSSIEPATVGVAIVLQRGAPPATKRSGH